MEKVSSHVLDCFVRDGDPPSQQLLFPLINSGIKIRPKGFTLPARLWSSAFLIKMLLSVREAVRYCGMAKNPIVLLVKKFHHFIE